MAEYKRNKYALRTVYDELIDDGYIDEEQFLEYIKLIFLSRTNPLKRHSDKGMAEIVVKGETTHLATRRDHMEQTASLASIILKRIGLNRKYSSDGMLVHDIGHSFYSHEGEVFLNIAGILLNAGFFHHNAKGIDDALTEGFIEKIVEAAIKSIDKEKRNEILNNPEIMKRLNDDAWYFLEPIVGHDGEATRVDSGFYGKPIKFKSIKDAIIYNIRKANSYNQYKANVTTLEAVIAKPADVIAYLKTDVENSFRDNIVKRFSDNYLEQTGALLFEKPDEKLSREERIKRASDFLMHLKVKKLLEKPIDENDEYMKRMIDKALQIEGLAIDKMKELGINSLKTNKKTSRKEIKQINEVKKFIADEIKKYSDSRKKEIDSDRVYSEVATLKHFVNKLLGTRKAVVEEYTEAVQQALINDYCENTIKEFERIDREVKELEKETGIKFDDDAIKAKMMSVMNFSEKVQEILYSPTGLKMIDYTEYVQYSKKRFQTNIVPKAAFKAIKDASKALVKTGVIKNKFNNPSIIKYITDEEVKDAILKNINSNSRTDKQNDRESEFRDKIGINEFKDIKGAKRFVNKVRYVDKSKKLRTLGSIATSRNNLYRNMYESVQRREETFALVCEDVYYAIPNTIKILVDNALNKKYKPSQCLKKEEQRKLKEIKKELKKRFVDNNGILTEENIQQYIQEKVEYERTVNFDRNVANMLSIKFLSGFDDEGIKKLLKDTGYLSPILFSLQDRPKSEVSESVANIMALYVKPDGSVGTINKTNKKVMTRNRNRENLEILKESIQDGRDTEIKNTERKKRITRLSKKDKRKKEGIEPDF